MSLRGLIVHAGGAALAFLALTDLRAFPFLAFTLRGLAYGGEGLVTLFTGLRVGALFLVVILLIVLLLLGYVDFLLLSKLPVRSNRGRSCA